MMPVAGQDMANVSPVFPGYPPTQNMSYPTQNSYPTPYSNFHYPPQLQGYHQPQYLPKQNFASQPQSPSQSMYPSLSHYPTEPRQYSSQSHFQSHSHSPSSQYFNSRVQVVRSSAQWSAGLGLSSKLSDFFTSGFHFGKYRGVGYKTLLLALNKTSLFWGWGSEVAVHKT